MKRQRGFTLIELLVSVALFSVVMVVALGALLALSASARKAESLNVAINNIGAAVDAISRTIRTGSEYNCGQTDPSLPLVPKSCTSLNVSTTAITFLAADGKTVITYCLGTYTGVAATCLSTGNTLLRQTYSGGTLSPLLPITTSEVNIQNFALFVVGACATTGSCGAGSVNDSLQPHVLILLSGRVQVTAAQSTTFQIQTSVTQRLYDI